MNAHSGCMDSTIAGEIWVDDALPAFLASALESELAFYQRRALEEASAAQRATCPQAAASHRYLAAAYAERVRYELEMQARFDDLLGSLSDRNRRDVESVTAA